MAGRVRVERQYFIQNGLLEMIPRPCPAVRTNGLLPSCLAMGAQSGHFNACPFLYGIELYRGGTVFDLNRSSDFQGWLLAHQQLGDHYRVLCLRKESADTEAGARYRP